MNASNVEVNEDRESDDHVQFAKDDGEGFVLIALVKKKQLSCTLQCRLLFTTKALVKERKSTSSQVLIISIMTKEPLKD